MSRRPWLGLWVSVAFHVGIVALVLVVLSREDVLPALMVDLRDFFGPGSASVKSRAREARSARSMSAPPPRKAQTEAAPVPLPTPNPPSAPASPPAPFVEASPPSPAPQPPAASEPPRDTLSLPSPPGDVAAPRSSGSVAGGTAGGGVGTGESAATHGSPAGFDPGLGGRREGSGPTGPLMASVPPGGGGGVGAEYGPYLAALHQRIQHSVRYPASARRRGLAGTVSVEVLILANGAIGTVTLLESSAHAVLDEAALETIRSLPRVPLPPDLPARPLRVRVPVVFEMR